MEAVEKKLDHAQVMKILPHRDPMLLVDEVISLIPGKEITASFFVKEDMDMFKGHFPDDPILPGVYTVESMAQASDILMMSMERYAGKTPLFLGIQDVKFKAPVRPGDHLILHAVLLTERTDKAILTAQCEAYLGETLASQCVVAVAMR